MLEITKSYLKEAMRSLYSSKQRSLLTIVGVVVGVSSMIAMVSIGLIVQHEALKRFRAQGTDIMMIRKLEEPQTSKKNNITLEDALGLMKLSTIVSSAPFLVSSWQTSVAKRNLNVRVFGVTERFAALRKLPLDEGRFISDLDHRRYFCVLGADIASALRSAGVRPLVGGSFVVREVVYTVVGVLRKTPSNPLGFRDANEAVFIPFSTAKRVFGNPELEDVVARMTPGAHHDDMIAQVKDYFRLKPNGPKIEVSTPRQLIEQMQNQMRLITLFLGSVGGISLLVGGLGVMNVMMATVSERRLEIGIKRALGARRRDIRWQFLIESLILSMLGGGFGIALGLGVSNVISNQNGWQFFVSPETVGLGFGITAGTGLFFGFYPAYMAARLDPIVALRGN